LQLSCQIIHPPDDLRASVRRKAASFKRPRLLEHKYSKKQLGSQTPVPKQRTSQISKKYSLTGMESEALPVDDVNQRYGEREPGLPREILAREEQAASTTESGSAANAA
jgi:hypothetical protein